MKKGLKILIITLIAIGIIISAGYFMLENIAGNPDEIIINDIDVSVLQDGSYTGGYATTLVTAKTEITVLDGRITDIKIIEHTCGPGHSAESLKDKIINYQSIDVDTISGSTMSSKVILKAIENALTDK